MELYFARESITTELQKLGIAPLSPLINTAYSIPLVLCIIHSTNRSLFLPATWAAQLLLSQYLYPSEWSKKSLDKWVWHILSTKLVYFIKAPIIVTLWSAVEYGFGGLSGWYTALVFSPPPRSSPIDIIVFLLLPLFWLLLQS